MYSRDELFQCSQEGYFCVYLQSGEATGEINTKITVEWALKQFVTRVHNWYIILFLTWHNEINESDDDKNNNLYTLSPCLTRTVFVLMMMSQSIADDVTIVTWILIHVSNSLDIDFIHGDNHGWLGKKHGINNIFFYILPPQGFVFSGTYCRVHFSVVKYSSQTR